MTDTFAPDPKTIPHGDANPHVLIFIRNLCTALRANGRDGITVAELEAVLNRRAAA